MIILVFIFYNKLSKFKNPKSTHGFVGAALSSAIWHFWKPKGGNDWKFEKIIQVEPISLEKSPNPVPGLITG